MNAALTEALRKVAQVQIKAAHGIASTQGQDLADELRLAYESLLGALDEKPRALFGDRTFLSEDRRARLKAKKKG